MIESWSLHIQRHLFRCKNGVRMLARHYSHLFKQSYHGIDDKEGQRQQTGYSVAGCMRNVYVS